MISFTRALAGAYSAKGVRVNAICPGVVLTERVNPRRPRLSADRGRRRRLRAYVLSPTDEKIIAHFSVAPNL
ncbi:MAG: SDR family oxidoreductase [Stellaceae bacterium]